MAKRDAFEEKLRRLRGLSPTDEGVEDLLRRTLRKENGFLVAEAAGFAREHSRDELADALVESFLRLVDDRDADKGCVGKEALAEALYALDLAAPEVFLSGVRLVQLEPGFGPPTDSAVGLRGVSALGLVRSGHFAAPRELARLLGDREPGARAGAARAMGYGASDRFEPLLHYKLLQGDDDPDVVQECAHALWQVAGEGSIELLTELLEGGPRERSEAAAFALGQSRHPAGLAALTDWWRRGGVRVDHRSCFLAIALSRRPEAVDFLVQRVAESLSREALAALQALTSFAHDPAVASRVQAAVETRDDERLSAALREEFPGLEPG